MFKHKHIFKLFALFSKTHINILGLDAFMATRHERIKVFNALRDPSTLSDERIYKILLFITTQEELKNIMKIANNRVVCSSIAYYQEHKSFTDNARKVLNALLKKFRRGMTGVLR